MSEFSSSTEFPLELFYPIEGIDHMNLRLTIGVDQGLFWVESALVSREGSKIIRHLGNKHKLENQYDAVQAGLEVYQKFRQF